MAPSKRNLAPVTKRCVLVWWHLMTEKHAEEVRQNKNQTAESPTREGALETAVSG
ncbi:hypothetical protein HPB52_006633 [Rhipicephalus sanguineus]|uniref:Uncharacterized protein n=1 Tax=Rhipicephalus sanguineus TaxID=34632 RepID=A0A9D4T7D3_RHISA|nr:hypothetical protein HPB52_006633 [Rhipicephalus sanguineus]